MQQYFEAKQQYSDAIVFFRMGDFYEMFYEDALTAARVLEIALTSRSKDRSGTPIPMCGVPHHAADGYITKLVRHGFRVAICEQVEDAKKTKKLVRRKVVRVVSPGTLTDASYLEAKEPAFLVAISLHAGRRDTVMGIALVDLSTGIFATAEYPTITGDQEIADELSILRPREMVVSAETDLSRDFPAVSAFKIPTTSLEPWWFTEKHAQTLLCDQMGVSSLDGFGLEGHPAAVTAGGALIRYLQDTQRVDLQHLQRITFRSRADYLILDPTTFKHLEILETATGERIGSLLAEIDRTITPMGGRLLRSWLQRPCNSRETINGRLDAVEEAAYKTTERSKLQDTLKTVHDLERLIGRVGLGTAGPRDLVALRESVASIPRVRSILKGFQAPFITSLLAQLDDVSDVRNVIEKSLVDDPPVFARDGGYIKTGIDRRLDDLRTVRRTAKEDIAALEQDERKRTGISSLKIRYNRVFGYYIEVSRSNLKAVPEEYQRKQTIASGERFITPRLKEYEQQVLGSDDRILEMEQAIFEALRVQVSAATTRIQVSAQALGTLDVLGALAEDAARLNYTKPQISEDDELSIVEGRHPVVEQHCADQFVPNDVLLNSTSQQLVILTGPNMGGKSTYLRQTALIVLLAHIGSFVPAQRAKIPLIDRMFARVGASDNIARGQSTFMVEMQETAKILHTATSNSLVLLDEIGRGTATFDGLSIAWAVAEHLATNPRERPKTLFATHYHELTDLADSIPGVINYHVVAREWQEDIIFLRKVEPGRSDRSYGIQVARLAGLPLATVKRAKDILRGLETDELSRGGQPSFNASPGTHNLQLGLFRSPPPEHARIIERFRQTDIDKLTPLEALTLLAELKKEVSEIK